MIALSYLLVLLTFPFSLFVCFKVSVNTELCALSEMSQKVTFLGSCDHPSYPTDQTVQTLAVGSKG